MDIDMKAIEQKDCHWLEVMLLAHKYGFVCSRHNGVVALTTHQTQLALYGERQYENIQGQLRAEVLEIQREK